MLEAQALVQQLAESLLKNNKRLALAESCTGGLLAALCTDRPGSSNWFECAWVTYSNAAKSAQIAVPESLIQTYGAVSCEVAEAMCEGALRLSSADFAISITGVAGPAGGTKEKPVGTVCFAWGSGKKIESERHLFPALNRHQIRLNACHQALKGAIARQ